MNANQKQLSYKREENLVGIQPGLNLNQAAKAGDVRHLKGLR